MKRRIAAFFAAFTFLFSTSAYAFQKSSYYEDLKIGLENMASNSIEVTLNGNYKFSDNMISSGTSSVLTLNNDKINMNGTDYDEITLVPENKDNTIKLKVGAKVYNYLGTMSFRIQNNKILPVNIINVEDYLKGVVGYEMSNSYPIEALKAQAVAARNYALSNRGKHRDEGYDLCDTTDCQVYKGYNPVYANVIKAVDDTRGTVLLYNDDLAVTYYASSDGGYTEDAGNIWSESKPYLKGKPDEFDSEGWPYGDMIFKSAEIDAMLKAKGYLPIDCTFIKIDTDTITKYPSGRVAGIDIVYKDSNGAEQRMTFKKEKARTFLSLPSSMYNVVYDQNNDTYLFSGKGYGHGIGMSQIGAKNRANAGHTYDSILTFYYDGTYLDKILANIKSLILSKTKLFAGDAVFFTVEGAEEQNLYKFVVEKDSNIVFTRDYSMDSSTVFTPTEPGNYRVHLYIKNDSFQTDYNDEKVMEFTVYSIPEINNITINPQILYEKKPFAVNLKSSGGSGSVQYRFEILKDEKVLASCNYSDSQEFTYTPDDGGLYKLRIYIKDKLSSKDYDSIKEMDLNVMPENNVSSGSSSIVINVPLKKGMKGGSVLEIQKALAKLGYNVGTLDGIFGAKTQVAVIEFQKSKGLKVDGIVNKETLDEINKSVQGKTPAPPKQSTPPAAVVDVKGSLKITRTLKKGMKGDDIKTLQQYLAALGYQIGTINGEFNDKTLSAVQDFQKKNGINPSGLVGVKTVAALNKKISAKYTVSSTIVSRGEDSANAKPSFKIQRILKKGSYGEDVKKLQEALRYLSYAVDVNGTFDTKTEIAVKSFQKVNKLLVDGIVGLQTAKAIDSKLK